MLDLNFHIQIIDRNPHERTANSLRPVCKNQEITSSRHFSYTPKGRGSSATARRLRNSRISPNNSFSSEGCDVRLHGFEIPNTSSIGLEGCGLAVNDELRAAPASPITSIAALASDSIFPNASSTASSTNFTPPSVRVRPDSFWKDAAIARARISVSMQVFIASLD